MMKKLFFFKASASNNESNNLVPSPSKERQSRSKKAAAYEDCIQNQNNPFLRRSRSYSSGTFPDGGLLRTQTDSPCSSSSNISRKPSASRPSSRALTPDRPSRSKWFQDAAADTAQRLEELNLGRVDNRLSETSSYCSNKVLDRYIDGEQHQEQMSRQTNANTKSHACQPTGGGKKPPRYADIGLTKKPRSHSFRDSNQESKLYRSTREWVENTAAHESPRKLAKHVIERLSQSRALPRVDSNEFDHDIPITLEDVYCGSQNCVRSIDEKNYGLDDDCPRVLDYEESEDVEEVTLLKAELDFRTRKLEKEKNELQLTLEKELDRRSTEWSMKLEKYKLEEQRLRERVRELAEQNVSLQREVSSLGEKELDNQSKVVHSGQQVKDLTIKMEEVVKEKQSLHQDLLELKDKYKAAEEDKVLYKRNFEAKDTECKELHKVVTRLARTSNEQEQTIEGLRESLEKEARNFDQDQRSKLQMEQLRLTGVEQSLRKEVESYRLEVDSLRHENINLLHRLKASSEGGCFSTFKLDEELWSRVHCLQNQGMRMIHDSVHLCSKLIENIKEKGLQNGLDSQFIMGSEMKVQGFKRGAESLTKSLQNVSDVLQEKSTAYKECSEDVMKSDLKAEALMTSLLREKLYSKEVDMERLEAELATAVRGNDVLRCEVQNAMDNLSCVTHKMKDLELQVIKKDESIYHLQTNLQDFKKELSMVNGILPKVSEERDMLWENVQQCSENNMLLKSEIIMLKKKVEALDEDVLMKEGQITILKDALGKPFDLLSSPVYGEEFLLR
ncbi:uncharacterized protein LOC143554129 [Bidens hawaiensis]|uniref:uncharacterized protein LOC143554129 n=1 Tax=Bidens hawaiensis TaxID=980011 RepID=UPI00404B677A